MRYGFRFVFLERRNCFGRCRRLGFWRLGFRLGFFFPQAFARIDGLAVGDDWLRRHRDSGGRTDDFYIDAAAGPSDIAPLRPRQVEIDRDGDPQDEEDVKNQRVDEKFSETDVIGRCGGKWDERVGGGAHVQRVRARSESGSVTILILLTPDWRRASMTLAKVPKGMLSSARRKTESCGFLSCALTFVPSWLILTGTSAR